MDWESPGPALQFSAVTADRTAICLGCRTSLGEGEVCDLGCQAGTLSLANPQDRELLIHGAWDRGVVRFSAARDPVNYKPLKLPAILSISGAVLATVGIVGGTAGGFAVVMPWLLVPILTNPSTRKLFSGVRSDSKQNHSRHQGIVQDASEIEAPASRRTCVAFSIRLTHAPTKSDTLIDAYSCGFDVRLADGRVAHIPHGRIRLEGAQNAKSLPPNREMPHWWPLIDPFHHPGEHMSPYPHSEIVEDVLRPGQSIVLQNQLTMTTRQHRGADYRDASANILEPQGVPHIKLVPEELSTPRKRLGR